MGKVGCDIWEKWAGGQKKKARIKGEIWEKWGATYGRNGYKKRSGLASGQMTMKTKKVVAIK